jgi:integrase
MPRCKLTIKSVAKLRAPSASGAAMLYWDTSPKAVRGMGVLCSGVTTAKSYIVQRDLPDGRTRRVTIGGVNELSLEAARARAAEILLDIRKGIDPKGQQGHACATLRATLALYRSVHAQRLRGRSTKNYQKSTETYLSAWLDKPLRELTREMVERKHREIADSIALRHRKAAAAAVQRYAAKARKAQALGWANAAARHNLAAAKAAARSTSGHATANAVMRTLRLLWNFAADRDATLGVNPVRLRKQWFAVLPCQRLVKADDLPAFYSAVMQLANPVHRDYLLLLLFTGLRRGEAAGLKWEDVDLRAGLIRISASSTKAKRKLDLPMASVVRSLLVSRRALGNATFVFPANSRSGHIEEPKWALSQVAAICGIHISVHDLRRTFITAAEGADISPYALKALVNHAVGGGVTGGYVIMGSERLREAAQKVCDRLQLLCQCPPVAAANVVALPLG